MQLIIFDLDRTLVRCDSFAGFNGYLLARQWWRVALVLAVAPALLPLFLMKPTRLLAASAVAWAGTVGLIPAQFDDLMERHVMSRFPDKGDLVCRTAVQTLVQHHQQGDRVVVVTGAPTILARRVCRRIGVPEHVEVLGSSLRRLFGGRVIDAHCYGPRKVRMLAEMGIVRADCVYTDSATDLPLMQLGARTVLVNASRRHRARVASKLGKTCEMVRWA